MTSATASPPGSPPCSRADDLDGPDGDASIRITVSRGAYRGRGLLPPDEQVDPTIAIQAWPVPADARRAPRGRPPPRVIGRPPRSREPAGDAQDDVACRLCLRPPRGATRGRRRRALPDDRRTPVGGHVIERVPRPARRRWRPRARHPVAGLRDPARDDPIVAARLGGPGRPPTCRGVARPPGPRRRGRGIRLVQRGRGPPGDPVRRHARSGTASPGRGRAARGPIARP